MDTVSSGSPGHGPEPVVPTRRRAEPHDGPAVTAQVRNGQIDAAPLLTGTALERSFDADAVRTRARAARSASIGGCGSSTDRADAIAGTVHDGSVRPALRRIAVDRR